MSNVAEVFVIWSRMTSGLSSTSALVAALAFSSLPEAMRECLAPRLVECVQRWLLEAGETARALLQAHRPTLRSLADALAKSEILHRAQILAIIETEGQPPAMKVLPGLDGRSGATPPSNGEGG